jgi:hypothetical protein
LDISDWRLVQANSAITYNLPPGTVIPDNGYVVIGRSATKTEFEAFWGSALPSNVVYINSGGAFPAINGSENCTLYNAPVWKLMGRPSAWLPRRARAYNAKIRACPRTRPTAGTFCLLHLEVLDRALELAAA